MFYRIFGGSGHGKTSYVFDKLSECVKNKQRAFLVVPEQSAVITEKQVIKKLGGKSNLYVEVINFKRLCNRVFRELGGLTSANLDAGAKKMLMLMSLDKITPFLKEYGKSAKNAEFAQKALGLVNEMNSSRVTPKMLEEAASKADEDGDDAISQKLCDIALIYESYNTMLSAIPGSVCDIYEKLCDKLREGNFFEGTSVFFDSFYGFTAEEYEIISLIAEQADDIYVTFCVSKDCKDEIFERSIKSARRCEKIAKNSGCEICDIELYENFRHKDGSDLKKLEENFSSNMLTAPQSTETGDASVESVVCPDIYAEAKWALSKVLEFVRKGDSFSDIVICTKNPSDYIGILDTYFAKSKIPLGIDVPETLSESALFELVVSAFEGASTFRNTSVIRYVKTGLSGLDEIEADIFETYVKTWNISPVQMKSDEDWTMNPDGYVDSAADEFILKTVNLAKSKVMLCLESLAENLKNCKTVKDYCIAVYNLIQDIKRASQKEAFYDGNGGKSLALLYECLDSFAGTLPDERITLSEFLSLFKSCGNDYNTGHIPSLANEVRFSDIDLVRCEGVKHVLVLGVNNGIFPSSCKSTSLISDSEKKQLKKLGIVLSESCDELIFDELFLAYRAVTSASESCHISCLAKDTASSVLYPSIIVTSIEKMLGNERKTFSPEDIENAFCGNELLFEEYMMLEEGVRKNTLEKYFSSLPEYRARIESVKNIKQASDRLLPSTTDKLYGNTIVTSYSRLEKMAGCPFEHFCAYTLRLKPEPEASLGRAEAGSVMHKILEELVPVLCTQKTDGSYPDENEAKQLVEKLLCEYLSAIAHTDVEKIPKRFVYLYNRLSRMLNEMAVNIVRELKVTKFVPCDFELNISKDADVKPFPVDLGDGCTLYIVGQIDRVDVYEKDGISYVKIIDYKTGKKTFKLKEIKKGFNLQMLLYMESIRRMGKKKYGETIVPAGVLYSNVTSAEKSMTMGVDDINEVSGQVSKPVSSGIFLDDDEVLFALDPTENSMYLPIGRKNGEVTNKDAVASVEEMGELLDFAVLTASELAKEMRNGLKSVTPFDGIREGIDINPCRYCEMNHVCMGDISEEAE